MSIRHSVSQWLFSAFGFVVTRPVSTEVSSDSEDQDVVVPMGRAWQDSHVGQQVAEPMSPRKNSRDGYLNKQGGHNANRGWRRRWVVFNGKNLSYYTDNTSQVSIRIIPVKCMVKVEQDIKDSDFRFKLHTTLKNRVFLFCSDTLADCLNWALTLEAAIFEYQKQKVEEASLEKPDKEGFFKIDSFSRKYYVTIIGPILQYYHSFEEYQLGSPIHQIDMKLASVKVKERKKFKLQLSTHYHYFELTFETDTEMQQWRMAMEDSIAEGLSDDTVLEKVYNNLSNRNCADCGAPDPHWASINLGIVVCKNCAGVHRTFDYRISKIRSLRMDTRVWTPSLIELMVTIGNANANAFWEFQLPDGVKADPADTMDKRKEYITKKYIGKKFSNLHALCSMGSAALGKELVSTASSDNVLETMKILFSGADVLFRVGTGQTAYDVAKENGQRLIMELLYQNSGDPQSQVENTRDENRLREDIRMQGYLNKPGPNGRTFEKRWCLLEHGCLTYYLNEKSTTFKGSIDRKDMYMIQAIESDRIGYHFELGTCMKENRTFIFSSDCKEDAGDWIRTIAKLMAPVAVMENVGMIDIKFAGIAYLRESLSEEWRQTFLIYSWRGLYYMNKDLKLDYLDLRKASGIKMLSSNEGFQKQGPFFIISSTGRSVYVQALLPRDTDKMFTALVMAYTRSGPYLNDQALTTDNVPVIVDRCITHISKFGLKEKGIYRQAGQQSRVQALLDEFKKDAYAVSLNDYTVDEVANAVKKFLRELDDSVFERRHYGAWIEIAGYQDESIRITKCQQLLDKMPEVNRQTLKRIIQHLKQVAQNQEENSMDLKNLATCFAPSLLRTHLDQLQMSDSSSREIKIVLDIMQHSDDLFQVGENEKGVEDKMSEVLDKIRMANLKSAEATSAIITDVYLMDYNSSACENFTITDDKTVAVAIKEAVDKFRRIDRNLDVKNCFLYEVLFNSHLERPLFTDELIKKTIERWSNWCTWNDKDIKMHLCVHKIERFQHLKDSTSPAFLANAKIQYKGIKGKFNKRAVGLKQMKLVIYQKPESTAECYSWNLEDITVYIGTMLPKKSLPSNCTHFLTFVVNGEDLSNTSSRAFGHCLGFDNETEMLRWAASIYKTQHPNSF
ncbi:arf-GAP with Rho-GAP domain, ANK repeat and PH domain-containing protein 2-like isoform X2 [Physella acuta]|uniref:arf-GAP with Rho-GAP domain, ANK repeat and PH domain-containing protein 2-like isoform X2 n=1 Tax=Physella acuta TaxID=109671 RepID=UPI0027DDC855|nr:arf-GAP with Rho-GAP domain, ANK repeat and PH domain-containing protein 2-like isoform X2 [Physella acuta]